MIEAKRYNLKENAELPEGVGKRTRTVFEVLKKYGENTARNIQILTAEFNGGHPYTYGGVHAALSELRKLGLLGNSETEVFENGT